MNIAIRRWAEVAWSPLFTHHVGVVRHGFRTMIADPGTRNLRSDATAQSRQGTSSHSIDTLTLKRPVEPGPEECCGRGCAECVWTTYWDDLKAYEAAMAKAKGIEPPIDPFEELERRLAIKAAQTAAPSKKKEES